MIRILHFAYDEKFLTYVQDSFEEIFPGASEFRIPGDPAKPLKFLKSGKNIRVVRENYWSSKELLKDLSNCDCLLIHYMNPLFARGMMFAPSTVLVGWIGWGGDYAKLLEPYLGNPLLPSTSKLIRELRNQKLVKLKNVLNAGKNIFASPSAILSKVSNKVKSLGKDDADYIGDISSRLDFAWVNPAEMDMFEKALPDFNKNYHQLFYYTSDQIFNAGAPSMDGPDILIGNSATATNNHIETMDLLLNFDLGDRSIIAPLNYGDIFYGNAIEELGRKKFGKKFIALRGYMSLNDYSEMLARCGTVIMNHVRQQAATTISTSLYKGAKVYLRDESRMMHFYKKMGASIFSIQKDLKIESNIFGPLTTEQTVKNKILLDEYWGHETSKKAIKKLEEMVLSKKNNQKRTG